MLNTNSIKKLRHALDVKEEDLLLQKAKVRDFIRTEHSSDQTKQYQNLIQDSEAQIDKILASILAEKDTPAKFGQATKELCQRCRDLQIHIRDMTNALANDLSDRRHVEEKKTVDVIKNVTFLVGVPGALITAVKNGVGGNHINVTEAAVAGVGVSVTILSRKKILKSFKAFGKSICELPYRVRNSFMLHYAKQTLRDGQATMIRTVAAGYNDVVVELPNMALRARMHFKKQKKLEG